VQKGPGSRRDKSSTRMDCNGNIDSTSFINVLEKFPYTLVFGKIDQIFFNICCECY